MRGYREIGPRAHITTCGACGEAVVYGYPDSHSNRCPTYGGHRDEKCSRCHAWYRPSRGWTGTHCPLCRGPVRRAPSGRSGPEGKPSIWYRPSPTKDGVPSER